MRTSTKVLLIIFVLLAVPAIFLARYFFNAIIPTEAGFVFKFDTLAYVGLGFLVVSMIFGGILYFRFVFSMRLSKAIFFSVFPLTIVYGISLYAIAIVGRYTTPIATSVKLTLNISQGNNYNSILWAVLFTGIYLLLMFIIFIVTCNPLQKVEKVAVRLGDGRVREGNINIGGIKQFKQIESSLEKINYNYREKENLVRKTDLEAQKFIPKQFLKFLGKSSITELELGNQVQKRATTLFCDFISEKNGDTMSLKENFNFVNSHLSTLAPIVRKFNGFIDKYMGDGILAVFGKAESAIDCAHAIIREVSAKNSQQFKQPKLSLMMSINTGEVVFGVVGEENRKSPTIISDVVNIASKMQEINRYLGTTLVFTKQTLNELPTRYSFDYRYIGSLTVDNSAKMALFESLEVYEKSRRALLTKTKVEFENGIRAYNDREYRDAREFFESVLHLSPDDRVSYVYYNKSCEKLALENQNG